MSQKTKCLETALTIAHHSIDQLIKIENINDCSSSSSSADIVAILKRFEIGLQSTLKKLIRLCMNKPSSGKLTETYKQMYSLTLKNVSKDDGDHVAFAQHLQKVLESIRKSMV